MMNQSRPLRFLLLATILLSLLQLSTAHAAELVRHRVEADGHAMALWEKSVPDAKGHILLHHGRTWSSLPDFDLQAPGEELSLMEGFNAMGFSVWALDARGYGGTARDSSGWNTPDRAAEDLAIVLDRLHARTGEKTHVWGWSYGSMVAQLAAQRYPDAFRSVTLFGYPTDPDAEVPVDTTSGAQLNVPVLLLQAEFDPLANTAAHARLFVKIPNANKQWVVLAGGAHAALLETPRARLIKASVDFMQWMEQ